MNFRDYQKVYQCFNQHTIKQSDISDAKEITDWSDRIKQEFLNDEKQLQSVSVIRILGAGTFGLVLELKDHRGKSRALKIQRKTNGNIHPIDEAKLQTVAAKKGIAVHVKDAWKSKKQWMYPPDKQNQMKLGHLYFILMDTCHESMSDILKHAKTLDEKKQHRLLKNLSKALVTLLTNVKQAKMTHGDMHIGNIVNCCTNDEKSESGSKYALRLIDFGRSSNFVHDPRVDVSRLLRSIRSQHGESEPHILITFQTVMQQFFQDHYTTENDTAMKCPEGTPEESRQLRYAYKQYVGYFKE